MQTILVAGAGKSSIYLIQYLLTHAPRNKWKVIVADGDENAIADKIKGNPHAEAAVIDITKSSDREPLVKRANIVVSLMPPTLHIHLAKDCLKYKKNLITSSYISDEMKEMDESVKKAGLMFMCEMGLDPGIDHMTANKIIHSIQRVAGSITSFKSYCGGLIAPESDNNPWHYKFSWNPKNVVTAGMGGAKYYPNRDSLRYLDLYEVPEIKTFLRATLRYPAFCVGWQALILLGLTNQEDVFDTKGYTYASWLKHKSGYKHNISLKKHVADFLGVNEDDKVMSMLHWLGLFEEITIRPAKQISALGSAIFMSPSIA